MRLACLVVWGRIKHLIDSDYQLIVADVIGKQTIVVGYRLTKNTNINIAPSIVQSSHINVSHKLNLLKIPNKYTLTTFKLTHTNASTDINYITPFNNQ